MKDHRRKAYAAGETTHPPPPLLSWISFFWFTLFLVLSSALLTTLAALRCFYPEPLHSAAAAVVFSPAMHAKKPTRHSPSITVRDTILFPDDAIVFIDYPPSLHLHTTEDIQCTYSFPSNSSLSHAPPLRIEQPQPLQQMVRCPLQPLALNVSLSLKSKPYLRPNHKWDPLVYHALFDLDNTTVLFVKGFNLKPTRQSNPTRFQCLFGWDFASKEYTLSSHVISAAQEIIRCKTPPGILNAHYDLRHSLRVSVRMIGSNKPLPTIAMPGLQPQLPHPPFTKKHSMCVCTMLRNQARFLKEWIMYHTRIGVQHWFIYDNNSDDNILDVIEYLQSTGHNITRHVWPWIKTQEAGFAHCALQARDVCEWVGFIDVDEFFHLKTGEEKTLQQAIMREAGETGIDNVGEIRTDCYSFGPSRLKKMPREGVMVGYTCRNASRERHKSIVRPEALHQNLLNVVHHFQLRDGYAWMDANGSTMAINHYKYQVWDVFKEKFEGRVSAYVVDWKTSENVGSKDRVPGLGSVPVEPYDWPSRFCEVWDRGLRNLVVRDFMDPETRLLPWQPKEDMRITPKRKRRQRGGGGGGGG